MNRPSPSDFVLGHRSGGVLFFCAALYALYLAATEQASWLVALFVVLLGGAARRARMKVSAYLEWRRRWDAMSGIAPEERRTPRRRHQRAFTLIAGSLAWLLVGGWLLTNPQGDGTSRDAVFGPMFAFLTLWGAGAAALSAARFTRRHAGYVRPRPEAREHIVTVCPAIPGRSSRQQVTAALPGYAVALLAHRDDAPAHGATLEDSASRPK